MQVTDIVTTDLGQALNDPNSPFKACSAYVGFFYEASGAYGSKSLLNCSLALLFTALDSPPYPDRVHRDAGELLQPRDHWRCR